MNPTADDAAHADLQHALKADVHVEAAEVHAEEADNATSAEKMYAWVAVQVSAS